MSDVSNPKWARRGEFVNSGLILGPSYTVLDWANVELDGIAGPNFDIVVEAAKGNTDLADDLINAALKYDVPVEGLVADGEIGDKFAEVVALCKGQEGDPWYVAPGEPESEDEEDAGKGGGEA